MQTLPQEGAVINYSETGLVFAELVVSVTGRKREQEPAAIKKTRRKTEMEEYNSGDEVTRSM